MREPSPAVQAFQAALAEQPTAESLAEEANSHFHILAERHQVTVAESYHAAGQSPYVPSWPVVDGLVEIIGGRKLTDAPALEPVDRTHVARHARGLLSYLGWVINASTRPARYLADIGKVGQALLTPSGVVLVDTDPYLIPPTTLQLSLSIRDVVVGFARPGLMHDTDREEIRNEAIQLLQKVDTSLSVTEAQYWIENDPYKIRT